MKHYDSIKVDIPQKDGYFYDILIGVDLLADANEIVHKFSGANKFLIVTNETVAKLYKNSLHIENSQWLILKDGEEYKNFDTLKEILDKAVEYKLSRNDCR